jgi:hypothetical protein
MWEPAGLPSPRAEGAAAESTLEVGAEPPVIGSSVRVPTGTAEAPIGTVEVPPLKDRLGDQRGGSEWELIKILLVGD